MKHGLVLAALMGLVAGPALAQDLCPALTRFLTDPPRGFDTARGAVAGTQRWATAPVVPNASCDVWQSREGDADTLHCSINDGAAASAVSGFMQAGSASIDRCLAGLPVKPWSRETSPVAVEGLRGTETNWTYEGSSIRFRITLADYLRSTLNTSYNLLEVKYLKY